MFKPLGFNRCISKTEVFKVSWVPTHPPTPLRPFLFHGDTLLRLHLNTPCIGSTSWPLFLECFPPLSSPGWILAFLRLQPCISCPLSLSQPTQIMKTLTEQSLMTALDVPLSKLLLTYCLPHQGTSSLWQWHSISPIHAFHSSTHQILSVVVKTAWTPRWTRHSLAFIYLGVGGADKEWKEEQAIKPLQVAPASTTQRAEWRL